MTEGIFGLLAGASFGVLAEGGADAGVPPLGGYLSITKIVVMLALIAPWLVAAPWVHKDSQVVRAPKGLWGSVILAVGGVAVVIWLMLPFFVAGLVIYVLTIVTLLVSYLAYRNGRVDDKSKINIGGMFMSRSRREEEKILTKLRVYNNAGQIVIPPHADGDPKVVHAYNLVQDLLYDMIWRRAGNAELSPAGTDARMRFVIDGVTVSRPGVTLAESEAIIQYLKPVAGMDADEHRRPQKGQIAVDNVGTQVDIVLVTDGTTNGQRMQFRMVQEFVQTELDQLGMAPDTLETVRKINKAPAGIFIVSGMPNSGVTSTLFSLLREHDAFMKQLATLEVSATVNLENITHHSYGDASKLPRDMATILRRDPDVIMVDNCPDPETAGLIAKAARRKMILLGMKASDSFTALAKWVKVCGDPAAAMESLHGVLCQMLMRVLCDQCREPYRPDPQLLAKANIPAETVDLFYRPPSGPLTDEKGNVIICPKCQGSGYYGRTAVFELLEITPEIKQLVVSGASLPQVRASARKRRMLYLQEQALKRVISGQTSVQELIRVSQKAKK
jgi:type II secretory ATPase GspE/PulE/Tfp pilus assembly ATPase PilB-like protein